MRHVGIPALLTSWNGLAGFPALIMMYVLHSASKQQIVYALYDFQGYNGFGGATVTVPVMRTGESDRGARAED